MAEVAFDIHGDEITFDGRTVGVITAGPSEGREALELCLLDWRENDEEIESLENRISELEEEIEFLEEEKDRLEFENKELETIKRELENELQTKENLLIQSRFNERKLQEYIKRLENELSRFKFPDMTGK